MPASAMKSTQHKKEPDRTGRTRPFFSGEAQVQTKLKVGRPGDRFEQEADRAADGVVHGRGPLADGSAIAGRLTPTAQRTPEDDEAQASPMDREAREPIIDELQLQEDQEAQAQSETEEEEIQAQSTTEGEELQTRADSEEEEEIQAQAEEEEELQAQAEAGEEEEIQAQAEAEEEEVQTQEEEVQARATQASSTQAAGQRRTQRMAFVQRRLRAARGLGNPLPEETRRRMQNRFGADLSGIRIHTDALAVELSKALRAQAFAHGRDIYFNANKFQPGTPEGEHLLAHEIAHTIQQGSVKQQVVQLQPDDSDVMMVRPEALEAIRLARAEEGLVNTKLTDAEGNRVGWERLLTYFRTAFGGDTIHPSVIQKITLIPDPAGGPEKVDALPHWCGIFAWWALKSAGVPLPDWKIGMSILEHVEPRPPGSLPQKGDIAYRRKNDHFALVSGLESVADAAGKPVKDVQVRTINGNTAGSDNLGGQV
ncbi:MAG TPA: DUF4157 domain-containing protein, partial [Alphaproteobacteria bacterium]|nr:DUF4157 domain-containing protein [Alphaproteobacteria bacterium]